MADWNEKMLDEELEAIMNDVPEQEDLEKKINQIINRRIRKVVMRTLSVITIVVLVLVLGISPLMNASFWNPYKMNKDGELLEVMGNYIEMNHPWNELVMIDVEKKGFARYEVEMQISDHTESLYIGVPNVKCTVKAGNYIDISDPSGMMAMHVGRFDAIDWGGTDGMIQDIEELPESAWLYLDLSSKDEKSIEHIQDAEVCVEWIQVHQPKAEFQGGIRLSTAVSDPDAAPWTMSGEELLELYLEKLESLLEHPEAWKKLQLCDGRKSVYVQGLEVLRDTYESAKELETVTTKNYCISGQRDEVLEYLKTNEFTDIRIEKVKLSIHE